MGSLIDYGAGGRAYLSTPAQGAGLGLLVIQEYWGLVPHIEDVCDRFAAEGFTALAPDLFHGATATEPDEAGKLMMAMDLERAAQDLSGAVTFLAGHEAVRGRGVGVVGFCMGGGLALVLASQRPDDVRACVSFYGLIPWPSARPDWSRLQAPVQLHIGEHDELFSPEAAGDLEATLSGLGKDVDVYPYAGAGHAFFNDTRPEAYEPTAAALAWTRTLEVLRAKLG